MRKRLLKAFIPLLVLLLLCGSGFAQTKKISGVVKDATNGVAISGATINVKGKGATVQSNANGEFSIDANVGDSLIFSHVGKKSMTQAVTQKNILEILLPDDDSQLGEVTVVAFGKQKNRALSALFSQ